MALLLSLTIVVTVIAGSFYWYDKNIRIHALKKKKKPKTKPKKIKQTTESMYRCVSIQPGDHPCQSALRLKGSTILMSEAEALPLKGCDSGKCNCKYIRYEDRRMSERRVNLYYAKQVVAAQKNRRKKTERRQLFKTPPESDHGLDQHTISIT